MVIAFLVVLLVVASTGGQLLRAPAPVEAVEADRRGVLAMSAFGVLLAILRPETRAA